MARNRVHPAGPARHQGREHGHSDAEAAAVERDSPGFPARQAEQVPAAGGADTGGTLPSEQLERRHAAVLRDERLNQSSGLAQRRANMVLQLQRDYGNEYTRRVVQRATRQHDGTDTPAPGSQGQTAGLVQRNPITSWLETQAHNIGEALGLESTFDANLGRAEAFRDHGVYGPENVTPDNGGGFEASYDPSAGVMRVVVRTVVDFQDALQISGGAIVPADPNIQSLADAAQALPAPQRAAFIANYQWQAAEKIPWMNQLESSVQTAWGGQHQFFVNRPQWEWIGARVHVDVQVREGSRGDNDHLAVTSIKMPASENLYSHGGFSFHSPGAGADALDQSMTLASTDVGPRPDANLLHHAVFFDHDSATLNPAARASLDQWIATFQGAPGDPRSNAAQVMLEAHASAPGRDAYNMQLSQQRAEAVRTYLAGNGFSNVATRVADDARGESEADPAAATHAQQAQDRRVDLIVDSGERQVLAAHEFGHTFGLGDEYATDAGGLISGTGNPTGVAAAHDDIVQDMQDSSGANLPGAIHENNDNIMSLGNAVRPQHYAPFHDALQTVTGVDEWALGAPGPYPRRPTGSPGSGSTP